MFVLETDWIGSCLSVSPRADRAVILMAEVRTRR